MLGALIEAFAPYGFLDGSKGMSDLERFLCKITLGALCKIGVDTVCGTSSADSSAMIERLTSHFPAGTSVKDMPVGFLQSSVSE